MQNPFRFASRQTGFDADLIESIKTSKNINKRNIKRN